MKHGEPGAPHRRRRGGPEHPPPQGNGEEGFAAQRLSFLGGEVPFGTDGQGHLVSEDFPGEGAGITRKERRKAIRGKGAFFQFLHRSGRGDLRGLGSAALLGGLPNDPTPSLPAGRKALSPQPGHGPDTQEGDHPGDSHLRGHA